MKALTLSCLVIFSFSSFGAFFLYTSSPTAVKTLSVERRLNSFLSSLFLRPSIPLLVPAACSATPPFSYSTSAFTNFPPSLFLRLWRIIVPYSPEAGVVLMLQLRGFFFDEKRTWSLAFTLFSGI